MDDPISSTTEDLKYLQRAGGKLSPDEFTEEAAEFSDCKNFDLEDDILDLAGGAKDALERHRSEDQIINFRPEKEEARAEAKASPSRRK